VEVADRTRIRLAWSGYGGQEIADRMQSRARE
jgi:hypothetical protein